MIVCAGSSPTQGHVTLDQFIAIVEEAEVGGVGTQGGTAGCSPGISHTNSSCLQLAESTCIFIHCAQAQRLYHSSDAYFLRHACHVGEKSQLPGGL
jgi:EAL domain-containing protein (putative c-di-GMP-specific phosphodiesterase class I)